MRKAGAKDYKLYSKKILRVANFFRSFADNQKILNKALRLIIGEKIFMLRYQLLIQK